MSLELDILQQKRLNDIPQFCYCAFPTKIHHNFDPWQKQHFQFDIRALLNVQCAQWADYGNTCGERNNAASKVNIIKLTG